MEADRDENDFFTFQFECPEYFYFLINTITSRKEKIRLNPVNSKEYILNHEQWFKSITFRKMKGTSFNDNISKSNALLNSAQGL